VVYMFVNVIPELEQRRSAQPGSPPDGFPLLSVLQDGYLPVRRRTHLQHPNPRGLTGYLPVLSFCQPKMRFQSFVEVACAPLYRRRASPCHEKNKP
jgi:hypothetical protein